MKKHPPPDRTTSTAFGSDLFRLSRTYAVNDRTPFIVLTVPELNGIATLKAARDEQDHQVEDKAHERRITVRAYLLEVLQLAGLEVAEIELRDRRK